MSSVINFNLPSAQDYLLTAACNQVFSEEVNFPKNQTIIKVDIVFSTFFITKTALTDANEITYTLNKEVSVKESIKINQLNSYQKRILFTHVLKKVLETGFEKLQTELKDESNKLDTEKRVDLLFHYVYIKMHEEDSFVISRIKKAIMSVDDFKAVSSLIEENVKIE